ncbi:MAG: hypothetical protein L3K23_06195 [Thermoplasmata archaeon]|nr:hypothetical protein [Thermoplasmata archaeon]
MVEYPNPVVKSVIARDIVPFVPVWLFGVVLAASLDAFRVANGGLPVATFFEFALVYTAVVLGLGFALFYRHFRSCPSRIHVDVEGITGFVPRSAGAPEAPVEVRFPYASFHSITGGGFYGPRVFARNVPTGPKGKLRRWDFLHLTPENATRVAAAYRAWRERGGSGGDGEAPETPSTPPAAPRGTGITQ